MTNRILRNMMLALIVVCGTYFWISCKTQTDAVDYTANISADRNVFTENDRMAAEHMVALHRQYGQDIEMNFADPLQYRHFKKQLYRAGFTEKTNPQLFKTLEASHAKHLQLYKPEQVLLAYDTTSDDTITRGIRMITGISFMDAASLNTTGLFSYPYEDSLITGTLDIAMYATNGTPVGPADSAQGYTYSQLTDLEVETNGNYQSATATAGDTIHSTMDYFFLTKDQVPHFGQRMAFTTNTVDTVIAQKPVPCVIGSSVVGCPCVPPPDPAQIGPCNGDGLVQCTSNKIVTVCMSRHGPNCTYCAPGLAGTLMFPLQGYAVYGQNIKVDGNGKPVNGNATITLTRLPVGGGCDALPLSGNFFTYTRVNQDTLFWNLPQAQFNNNCLKYGDSVLLSMYVKVVIGVSQSAYIYVSNAYNTKPSNSIAKVAPIQVVSGCLAAGTMVTLFDGSKKKIEEVDMREKLKCDAAGNILSVDYNTYGPEKKPCIRIIDDKGHNLLMTDGHPVITPGGVVLAMNLKVGDEVETADGVAKLISVTKEKYGGQVWNLSVGSEGDAMPLTKTNTTFYANGILVGDHKMQQNFVYNDMGLTQEQVLKMLPKEWHQDYLNSLKH